MRRALVLNHFAVARSGAGGTRHVELFSRLTDWDYTILAADRVIFSTGASKDPRLIAVPTTPYSTNGMTRVVNWASFAVAALLRGLFIRHVDVVYGSSPHLLSGLAGRWLAVVKRVPFVLEIRDLWPEVLAAMDRIDASSGLYRLLERIEMSLYRAADRIVVLAAGTRKSLIERGVDAGKIVVIPNGADPSDFEVTEERSALREAFGFTRDTYVYAGAHGPANGLQYLIDAAAAHQEDDLEVVLVGGGVSKDSLIEYVEARGIENVRFMDPIAKEEMPRLLRAADVGVHVLADVPLFRYAVSPNKVFDYLAAGLPTLTNCPGEVTEVVESSGGGIGVQPNGLSEGMSRMHAADESQRSLWRTAGPRWMKAERSRTVLAARLQEVLDDLVTG